MISGIPLIWALEPECEILLFMWSFGPRKRTWIRNKDSGQPRIESPHVGSYVHIVSTVAHELKRPTGRSIHGQTEQTPQTSPSIPELSRYRAPCFGTPSKRVLSQMTVAVLPSHAYSGDDSPEKSRIRKDMFIPEE